MSFILLLFYLNLDVTDLLDMKTKSSFHLKKWYFDCTTEDGRVLICYAALLHWRAFKVGYVSYIYVDGTGERHHMNKLKTVQEPEIEDKTIRWHDSSLDLSGSWHSAAPPIRTRLHDTDEGYLDWHCMQPAAQCSIRLGNDPNLSGWGYVECLEMTLPPWKMDFNELRWGRFTQANTPLVWIELRGKLNRFWVFDGQASIPVANISEEAIVLPESHKKLLLSEPYVLEDTNKIKETVDLLIRWMPGIDRFTPLHFLSAQETKWRSKGTLLVNDQVENTGWVIHELVKF